MYQPKKQQRNDLDDYFGGDDKPNQSYQAYDRKQNQSNNSQGSQNQSRNYQPRPQSYYNNNQNYEEKQTYNDQDYYHSNKKDNNQNPGGYNQYSESKYDNTRFNDNNYNQQSNYQDNTKYSSKNQNGTKFQYRKDNQDDSYNQSQAYQDHTKYSFKSQDVTNYSQYQDDSKKSNKYQDNRSIPSKNQDQTKLNQNQHPQAQADQQKDTQGYPTKDDDFNNYDNDIHDYNEDDYDDQQDFDEDFPEYNNNQEKNSGLDYEQSSDQSGGKLKILMVAEKNSIAEAISKALGSQISKSKGRTQCHYFTGQFKGQKASFTVTATNGHIFNRDFSKDYADWESVDPIKLFRAPTLKKPTPKSGTVRILQTAAQDCNYLLLWLDNDREGENICFEVEEVCQPYLRKGYKVLRAKFSAITSQDLQEAYNNIHLQPNLLESLIRAVDARQIIDLKIGVAFSRYQTMYFAKKYPALKDKLITYGPCQTPTLGFCVKRHEEIVNFIPKTYYQVQAQLHSQGGFKQNSEWEGERIWKEKEAQDLVQKLKQYEYFDVVEATTKQTVKTRPEGVNTVNLLKFASSYLGIGPQQTMHVAEKLYLSGFLSYPRTESTTYPQNFATDQILKELQSYETQEISKHAQMLSKNGHSQPKSGKDAGDHPPITPTIVVPPRLLGNEKGIYEYVVKMFLATHSGDCIYNHSILRVKPSRLDVSFKLSGNKIITPGFTAIASWLSLSEDTFDPQKYITPNGVQVAHVDYKVSQTKPPDHLTESELIGLMEQYGIGTDASMATHINNICERNYVRVEQGARRLAPTELGLCLVKGYKKIDAELVAPLLRSNIEKHCDSIAKGTAKFQDVIDQVIEQFEEKFIQFRNNISKMDEIFAPKSEIIGKQTQAQKGHKKGGYKGHGGKKGRNQDAEEGPSHVPISVYLADFVKPALEAVKQKPKEEKKQIQQPAKKNFKQQKDGGDLLY